MGGCASKPKTTEYEGLMDPHGKGHGILGRNSMDTDNGTVDAARQSEDSGLKVIGRSNSAQKGSERSLQNLFVKVGQQQERGDGNLEASCDTTLRDVLRSIDDPKKQTIAGSNPETNLVKAEERESDPKENHEVLRSGEEATVMKSPGKVGVATGPLLKNAQDEPAPAVPFQESSADGLSALLSDQAQDVEKECAEPVETEPQEKNKPFDSERREMLKELVVASETQSPSHEHSLPGEESTEQAKASGLGIEVVKPVDSDRTKEETSGSDTVTSSQASDVTRAIVLTQRAASGSDGSLAMKAEVFDELKAAASIKIPYEGVSKSAESEELGRMEERIGWKNSEEASVVDGSDLPYESATRRGPDASACSPLVIAIENISHAEDGIEVFGDNGLSAEVNTVKSLDNGAAARESLAAITETCDPVAPIGELKGQDQSLVVPLVFTDLTKPSRIEAADKKQNYEECTEILPDVEGSLLVDSSTVAEAESAEFSVQDGNQMSTVDELQSRLAPNVIPRESSSSQAGTPSTSVDSVDSDINDCTLNQENISEENSRTVPETEFYPTGANVEGKGSELPPKIKFAIVLTKTNSTDCEPAPSQESMHPEQDWSASSPDLGESEASTRQQAIGKGDAQEIQQSDVPSTQEGSNLCDQLPSTGDQVVELPQGFLLDSGQLTGIEEQYQAISQPSQCLEVTAQKVLLPEIKSGKVIGNEVQKKPISKEQLSTKDVASSDIDQVLEKLASEFERQASAEMGGELGQECSTILIPSK